MTIKDKRNLVLGVTLVVGILAAGIGGALLAGDESSVPPAHLATITAAEPAGFAFEPAPELSSAEKHALFALDREYLSTFTRRYGADVAVARLSELQEFTGQDCHYPAHAAGKIAYEMFGAEAFALVGHLCQSGAMHAVVEEVLRKDGVENLPQNVEIWCRNATRAFFRHNCIHGIGHGLLVWAQYELPRALPFCDELKDEEDRYSCLGGMFMENIRDGLVVEDMAMAHEHPNRYLRPDDMHFPCSIVSESHKPACYFYQTSHMYNLYGRDFLPVVQECANLSQELQPWCFRSLGRDAGHHLRDDPAKALDVCNLAPEWPQRIDCQEEAVQHRFWETFGDDWVLEFCGLVETQEEKSRCYWKVAWRATELYETPRDFRSFCGRFESRYGWLCDFVLYQQLSLFDRQGRGDWISDTPIALREFRERCDRTYDAEHCDITMLFQLQQLSLEGGPGQIR